MIFNASRNFTFKVTTKFPWTKEILNLTIVIMALIGQFMVFIAMYRHRNLRNIPNLILLNLNVADCLFCACDTSVILYIFSYGRATLSAGPFCPITGFAGLSFAFASINTLVFVSIERYMATNYPFRHRVMFNTKFVRTCLVGIWCFSAFEGGLPFATARFAYVEEFLRCIVDWTKNVPTTVAYLLCGIILPLTVLIYCNIHVWRAMMKSRETVTQGGGLSVRLKMERQMSVIIVVVITTFFICWAPYSIAMTCLLTRTCTFPQKFMWAAAVLAVCNSACNPIIYGIMNKNFRKAFWEILRCK